MFDLETAITDWRQQMLAAGIPTPGPLEELESHLREDVEQQLRSGASAQRAFARSAERIGPAAVLKKEFRKANASIASRFVELAGAACAAVAFFFLAWCLFVLFDCETSLPAKAFGLTAVATALLSWRYGHRLLPVIRHRLARAAAGMAGCIASVLWIGMFVKHILPHLLEVPAGSDISADRLIVSFLWAWAAMGTLAGLRYGLEKAADRKAEAAAT